MHEEYFLAQILQRNKILYETSIRIRHFSSDRCKRIFGAMMKALQSADSLDEITISQTGDCTISELIDLPKDAIPSNWKLYQKKILDAYRKHELIVTCDDIIKSKYESAEMIISKMMDAIDNLDQAEGYKIHDFKDVLMKSVKNIEDAVVSGGDIKGVPTGMTSLDMNLSGFQNKKLYVVGGRPSEGKSALMVNFMLNADVKVGVITAESASDELGERSISRASRINGTKLTNGLISNKEFKRVTDAVTGLYDKEIKMYDEPNAPIENIVLRAIEMKRRFDIKILFVDYIQIIENNSRQKKHEQVADVSMKLKQLARNLDIPVVALAQLKRDVDGRKPVLSDLSDSTQIERDADAVIFIHNKKIEATEVDPAKEESWLVLAKNRDGAKGDIRVEYEREYYTFREMGR